MEDKGAIERQIAHLEVLRADARDEIKRRIEQRDKYSIQLTIALGTLLAVAFSSQQKYGKVLLAAPLVSIYYTVLILYSYQIHTILSEFLRKRIEPMLTMLCNTPKELEWEEFFQECRAVGMRRSFFLVSLWVVSLASLAYLWTPEETGVPGFRRVLCVVTVVYVLADAAITAWEIYCRVRWRKVSAGISRMQGESKA